MALLIKGGNSSDKELDEQFFLESKMRYIERMKKYNKYKDQVEVIFSGDNNIDEEYFDYSETLRYIEISEGVRGIFSAFIGCAALQRVILPKTVDCIWANSFQYCKSLKSIELPPRITEIGDETFWDCKSLEYIYIPEGVTTIGSYAFSDCISLRRIYLPQSVCKISNSAFDGCTNLERVEGGAGIKKVEGNAFADCINLKEFPFSSTIESIEPCAFDNTKVEIPKSILLDDSLCKDGLTVTVPDGTITLTNSSLSRNDDNRWERVILPDSVKNISAHAFVSPEYLGMGTSDDQRDEQRNMKIPKSMNMPKNYFRQKTVFDCEMAFLLADTVWKDYVCDMDFEIMLLHQDGEDIQSELRKRLSENCRIHLENMLNCTDNSPLQLEHIAAYAVTYAGKLDEEILCRVKKCAEKFRAYEALRILMKYYFADYGGKSREMNLFCCKNLSPYEADLYFSNKEWETITVVRWKNSDEYVPFHIVYSVLYAYIKQTPKKLKHNEKCPPFHKVSGADFIASEFDREGFLRVIGRISRYSADYYAAVCRYADDELIRKFVNYQIRFGGRDKNIALSALALSESDKANELLAKFSEEMKKRNCPDDEDNSTCEE